VCIACRGYQRRRLAGECIPALCRYSSVHPLILDFVFGNDTYFQVLPLQNEAPDLNSGVKEKLYDDKDIKIEVMRARGAGGQHVNKTESAVRLTHIPTGISVSMQDERSQHMNKARAYRVLEARLLDRKLQAEVIERRETRRQLVRSADRSEKIRTYNFVQDRVTDHRIGLTLTNITAIMNGDVYKFTKALKANYEQGIVEDLLNSSET